MQESIIKKIDDHYRIIIPMEIREKLGIHKQQELEISINKNKQIVIKPIIEPENIKVEEKILKEEPIVIPPLEERISSKILDKDRPKSETCYKCGSPLEEGNRLKLNR